MKVKELECPVLLVCGEHDEAAPVTVKAYCDLFPRAEMAVLPDASHLHHLEQPVLFRDMVNEFVNQEKSYA
jgi:pimeloyl-ACP methyl ester carboxylesterase